MLRVLTLHLPGAASVRRNLAGPVTAGGSRADGLHVPGLPARALRLVPATTGVVVEAGTAGVRVAGHVVHAGARRLLRPGERIELPGAALALERPDVAGGTRAAASPLLRGEIAADGPAVVVLTGPRAGDRQAIGAALTAGRGRAASLRLPDPLASRVHVRFRASPEGVTVEDLGSKNGVRVNGVKVERGPFGLEAGDEITLGDTLLCLEDSWPGADDEAEAEPAAPRADGAAPPAVASRRPPHALAAALLLALSAAALAVAGS